MVQTHLQMCQVFEMSKRLQNLKLFDFVVVQDYLCKVWALLQNFQSSTQSVVRQIKLFQVFKLWEASEICDGGVAEVEGLEVGELAGETLDVNVPAGLHSAQIEVAHLQQPEFYIFLDKASWPACRTIKAD